MSKTESGVTGPRAVPLDPDVIQKLRQRRMELERDAWDLVCGSRPSGDGACDAFDQAERELYQELAAIDVQLGGGAVSGGPDR